MSAPKVSGPQQIVAVSPPPFTQPVNIWKLTAPNWLDGYLACDPNNPNHLVGVCRRFYGSGENYQDQLASQVSFDGGQTWETFALPLDQSTYYSTSDPWIGIGPDGTVYVIALGVVINEGFSGEAAFSGNGVLCYTSPDGGISWSQPVAIVSGVSCDQTFGGVDPKSGRVYAIWFDGSLALAYSDDQGQSWHESRNAHPQYTVFDLGNEHFNFVNMSIGPDSAVHIIGMDVSGVMMYCRSLDSGYSFEWGQIAAQQDGVNDIQLVISAFEPTNQTTPTLAVVAPPTIVAGYNGHVCAAWSVDTGHAPDAPVVRVCFASSFDNGQSWISNLSDNSAPQSVPFLPLGSLSQTAQDHYFRPRLCLGPSQTIACVFSYCKVGLVKPSLPASEQLPVQFGTYLAVSSLTTDRIPVNRYGPPVYVDEGYFKAVSTTIIPVSANLSNLALVNPVLRWGVGRSYFIGDFLGLCASPTAFLPYWSEAQGTWQLLVSLLSLSP